MSVRQDLKLGGTLTGQGKRRRKQTQTPIRWSCLALVVLLCLLPPRKSAKCDSDSVGVQERGSAVAHLPACMQETESLSVPWRRGERGEVQLLNSPVKPKPDEVKQGNRDQEAIANRLVLPYGASKIRVAKDISSGRVGWDGTMPTILTTNSLVRLTWVPESTAAAERPTYPPTPQGARKATEGVSLQGFSMLMDALLWMNRNGGKCKQQVRFRSGMQPKEHAWAG
ncbi:hypothetical protein BGZ63DRAFT_398635 [Mariannaea sp. PMI_226]|nr:hypothetical protein BGZ63DRAFT_398635 [Mariannaea sp. PMI_226]